MAAAFNLFCIETGKQVIHLNYWISGKGSCTGETISSVSAQNYTFPS